MNEIRLEEAKIKIEGQWLSAEDLTHMIQEKMKGCKIHLMQQLQEFRRNPN